MDLHLGILLKLVIAGVLTAVLGIEREAEKKGVGLRTMMLIGVNSALVTSVVIVLTPERIYAVAAALLGSIGFIGAGTIVSAGGNKVGITTAASLLICVGIGFCVGANFYVPAIGATILSYLILDIVKRLEPKKQDEFLKKEK